MTHTTILCPIDFSAATERLVAYAAALAAGTGAELRLLHVLEPQPTLAMAVSDLDIASQLAHHHAAAKLAGAQVSTVILHGDAAQEIVAEAKRHTTDMIVIGAHGQTGLTRFLMGNTAESVVRTAPCATFLMKCRPAETLRQSA
ncbi:universal stress protein [Hymenobacter sp. HDW8]|uniref:universal stress protein n=1 Tax=Hymenobacter sp. HDW8 TaxID=2714932 RepID=UPI001409A816|nr:universal stress protein [Hymenobacter sp. HDW8]QIL76285.1 universal stress protein [Hymenobacter sp. HDW8]